MDTLTVRVPHGLKCQSCVEKRRSCRVKASTVAKEGGFLSMDDCSACQCEGKTCDRNSSENNMFLAFINKESVAFFERTTMECVAAVSQATDNELLTLKNYLLRHTVAKQKSDGDTEEESGTEGDSEIDIASDSEDDSNDGTRQRKRRRTLMKSDRLPIHPTLGPTIPAALVPIVQQLNEHAAWAEERTVFLAEKAAMKSERERYDAEREEWRREKEELEGKLRAVREIVGGE